MTDENNINSQEIEDLKRYILSAENSLEAAKRSIANITGENILKVNKNSLTTEKLEGLTVTPDGKVIEGIFDGENMIGPDGKIFPVPANYASKSKLIEGDKLKLTVSEDGTFIYKQIGPAPRKSVIGTLNFSDNSYHVLAEGKSYDILYASVTYYKAKSGDRVTIVVPDSGDSRWASLDNVIHNVKKEEPEENILDDSEIEPDKPTTENMEYSVPTEEQIFTPVSSPDLAETPPQPQENTNLTEDTPVITKQPVSDNSTTQPTNEGVSVDNNPPQPQERQQTSELDI